MKEFFTIFSNFPSLVFSLKPIPIRLTHHNKITLIRVTNDSPFSKKSFLQKQFLYDPSAAFYIIDHSIFLDTFFVFKYITFHGFPLITVVASSQLLILHPSSIFKCWSTSRLSPLISSLLCLYSFFFMLSFIFMVYHMSTTPVLISLVWSFPLTPDSNLTAYLTSLFGCLLDISKWAFPIFPHKVFPFTISYSQWQFFFFSQYHIHNSTYSFFFKPSILESYFSLSYGTHTIWPYL